MPCMYNFLSAPLSEWFKLIIPTHSEQEGGSNAALIYVYMCVCVCLCVCVCVCVCVCTYCSYATTV
jgi:hypothetical protein